MSELRVGDLAWAAIPETRMVGAKFSSKLTWLGGKSRIFKGEKYLRSTVLLSARIPVANKGL